MSDIQNPAAVDIAKALKDADAEEKLKKLDADRAHDEHPDDGQDNGDGEDKNDGAGKSSKGSGDASKSASQATLLADMARRKYRITQGTDGKPYAVRLDGPQIAMPLRGHGGLRKSLAVAYRDTTGTVPGSSALADAMTVLEGQADSTDAEPVSLRTAASGSDLVLDLGRPDGRCVIIAPGEWHLSSRSPVLFRRTNLTSAIPEPERTASGLDRLREILNVSETGFRLLVAWLVAALFPDIAHAILALAGEQGTAKSTCGRMLVTLIDPSPAPLRSTPKDADAWNVQAGASWVVMLDNVSTISPAFSDTLCKAVTGDGSVKRALFTDDDVAVVSFRRVVAMTTIDTGALRGDLAERLLLVELDPIPKHLRRTEQEVNSLFERHRRAILAAILDLAAKVLAALPAVEVAELPRLADFAKILAAIDQVTGWNTLADYFAMAAELTETVIETDPFAEAVRRLALFQRTWRGTAGALLELVTPVEDKPKNWPRTPRGASGHLRRIAPALRAKGIDVVFKERTESRREIAITVIDNDDDSGSSAIS